VRLIDILPTVLDVLDLSGSLGSTEGLSLIPLLSGSGHTDRVFISDLAHKNIPELYPAMIATNRDDLKFIIHRSSDGKETVETFNLTQDPDERTDISVRTQKIRDEVLRLLDDYYRLKSQLDKGREQIQMTRDLEERLKALGYLR
jgi:arylsulfatase A-like enzyme